ncbi:MAG TPA: hypothetical protein VKV17_10155 [Bryobacteraceae bacterium]|nr:hypothetical protein [Bryobacteraceae bacterium]
MRTKGVGRGRTSQVDVCSGLDCAAAQDPVRETREFLTEAERYLAPYLSGEK